MPLLFFVEEEVASGGGRAALGDALCWGTRCAGPRRAGGIFDSPPRPLWTPLPPCKRPGLRPWTHGLYTKLLIQAPGSKGRNPWWFQGVMGFLGELRGKSKSPYSPRPQRSAHPRRRQQQSSQNFF